MTMPLFALLLSLLLALPAVAAPLSVLDDDGQRVTLAAPARRIISLAPHITELVFAAGAGKQLIAVDQSSDYPAAAKALPRAGSFRALDLERIAAARPDLLLVWLHGPSARQLAPLRKLGIPLYYSQPRHFADIASSLRRIGTLAGTTSQAEQAARQFEAGVASLQRQQQGKTPLRVFYQVWDKPLYTLNRDHIINDAITLCGGRNVFAGLPVIAPVVSEEAVLAANPEVIISAAVRDGDSLLQRWQALPGIAAVQNRQLYSLDGDLLNRPTPRLLDGTRQLCARLDQARASHPTPRPTP